MIVEHSLLFCAPPNAGSLQFRMLAKRIEVGFVLSGLRNSSAERQKKSPNSKMPPLWIDG